MFDYAIIGGGIVGLATALALCRRYPKAQIILFEKEPEFARHQSGRNSGVIHSGIYYTPGSLKARFAREGNHSMIEFCRNHCIPTKSVARSLWQSKRRNCLFSRIFSSAASETI